MARKSACLSASVRLNILLTPGCKPVYRDWDALFNATNTRTSLSTLASLAPSHSEGNFQIFTPSSDEKDEVRSVQYNKNLVRDTEKFWGDEHQRQPPKAESDVIILSQNPENAADPSCNTSRTAKSIKARMTVSLWIHNDTNLYLVNFGRSQEDPSSMMMDAKNYSGLIKPIRHETMNNVLSKEDSDNMDDSSVRMLSCGNAYDLTTPEDVEIQNQLIPHIMAILDPEGQAMCFSDSWYQFCGLSEEESLGSGWTAVIHPDDIKPVTESWANVIRTDQGNWTWEVRYRRSDGVYTWFIVRAQPYKDKNGKTLRWYASMLDIDSYVQARNESEDRSQSILKLLSQADMSLWGVNQADEISIREGHLDWNPQKILGLIKQWSGSTKYNDTGQLDKSTELELAKVICLALDGHKFPSAVEHQEGDRYFQTRFVSDTRSRQDGDQSNAIEAALALTYEITEIKKRSLLQLENERLAINEKAAKEASNLKSSFLANVSTTLYLIFCTLHDVHHIPSYFRTLHGV